MTYPRIRITQNLDKDISWAGPTAIMAAGEDLVFGDPVYMKDDNKMWKAKADAAATMPCIALAVGSITAGTEGEFLLDGFIRNGAWTWTPGGPLYIDKTTAGALTHTKPVEITDHVQMVGKAFSAEVVLFRPGECICGGGGDMFKATYDPNADGVVKNSDKLEGSTKAQVRDHAPKAHTLGSHSTKAHTELTGVTPAQHHARYTNNEAIAAVEAAGLALATGKNIKLIANLTADHTWSGLSAVLQAGENLTIGQVVYVKNDGKMRKALSTAAATMPAIAIATGTINADAWGEFLLIGFFRDDSLTFALGDMLYVSDTAAGAFDNALPANPGEQVQVIGKCLLSTHIVYFNPSLELVEIA